VRTSIASGRWQLLAAVRGDKYDFRLFRFVYGLLARETPTANQMVEALRGMARPAGVDVFLHVEEAQTEPAFEVIQRRADMTTTLLGEVLHQVERQPYRHWGINE